MGEQAREKLSAELASNRKSVEDPCLNDGFTRPEPRNDVYDGHASLPVTGKGDAASCRKAIESALFSLRGSCAYQSCSFDPNVYQPSDLASGRLLAFENRGDEQALLLGDVSGSVLGEGRRRRAGVYSKSHAAGRRARHRLVARRGDLRGVFVKGEGVLDRVSKCSS